MVGSWRKICLLLDTALRKHRLGRELVVVSIDFEKAFDSVERVALVRALKYYTCYPRLIEVVMNIYI